MNNASNASVIDLDQEDTGFAGFSDYNEFFKEMFRRLMLSTQYSNALPSEGADFDYYSSFTSVQQAMDVQGTRILSMIQDLMRYYGVRGNLSAGCQLTDHDDRLDVLVDANDQLLERVGTHLDEAAGLKKDSSLVVVTHTPKSSLTPGQNKQASSDSLSSAGFKFVSAKNIPRPQLSFKDKIDNVNRPFVPSITSKPNAMKSLEDSMTCEMPEDSQDIDPNFCFPHPYQFELDHFTPNLDTFKKVEPRIPDSRIERVKGFPLKVVGTTWEDELPTYNGPAQFLDTEEELIKLCRLLKKEKEIAVDLENHSFRSFQGFTCLMQLSTRSDDFIVDVIKLRQHMHLLNDVFTDPDIVKIFHGADSDVVWLQRDFGVYVVNMFDTSQASRVLGFSKYSLAYLLDKYCSVIADKQYQMSDWRIRPLPLELLKYAQEDTHYLLYIYDRLRNDLIESDKGQNTLLSAVVSRSTQICTKRYSKPKFSENSHKELLRLSKKVFNGKQLETLRGLYAWRDQIARLEDESIGYVLPNHMMLQIAELLPKEPSGILACCHPLPPLVRQNVMEIHEIIRKTRDNPQLLLNPERLEQSRPTKQQHPKYHIDVLRSRHDNSHQNTSMSDPSPAITDVVVTVYAAPHSLSIPGIANSQRKVVNSSASTMDAVSKAAKIAASLVNPFTKYLPEELIHETSSDAEKVSLKDSGVWRLLPNTVKHVQVASVRTVEVIETDQLMEFKAEPQLVVKEEPAILRDMVCDEKRATRLLEGLVEMNVEVKKEKKRKSDEVEIMEENEELEEFKYDSKSFQNLMQGESSKSRPDKKKKKKDYNPNESLAEPDLKAARRPRMSHPVKSKSMTYACSSKSSGSTNTPKIPWPSK